MPEKEQAICTRLQKARESSRFSRVAFAGALGIPTLRLASYELGRVVLPYSVGVAACRQLNVNQRWLATGEIPMRPFFPVSRDIEAAIKGRDAFSDAYEFALKSPIHARWIGTELASFTEQAAIRATDPIHKVWERVSSETKESAISMIYIDAVRSLAMLNDAQAREYETALLNASWRSVSELLSGKTSVLDNVVINADKPSVPLKLKNVLDRVRAVCKGQRGKMRALSLFLDVPQSYVSAWLRPVKPVEPGGEAAFGMLAWVTAEEGQPNKSAADAITPATPKTRTVRKQLHEAKQPEPKKGSQTTDSKTSSTRARARRPNAG